MAKTFFDGSLYIDWSESVGHDCKIKLSGWNSGLAVSSIENGKHSPLSILDVGDWIFNIHDPAIQSWRNSLPDAVNLALSSIPSHYAAILRWAPDSTKVVDLLISNPILLWLLVDEGLFGGASLGELNRLLSEKQTRLAKALGLSGSRQQIRLLKAAAGAQLNASDLKLFKQQLENRYVCDYLAHHKEISSSLIQLLRRYPWLVTCSAKSLIQELDNIENLQCFRDVVRMLDDLAPVRRCRSIASLKRLHDRLVTELNAGTGAQLIRDEYGDVKPLPTPPLAGNECIQPLVTQRDIADEGRLMSHCIASYLGSVLLGEYYVYRMEGRERLTIGVSISNSGNCYVDEVRGQFNRWPSMDSMREVEAWFESVSSQRVQHRHN